MRVQYYGLPEVPMRVAATIMMYFALTSLSCSVNTRVARPPLSITVDPAYVCPSEAVTVTWDAGEQDDSPACGRGLVGTSGGDPSERCIFIELSSTPTPVEWDTRVSFQTQSSRGGIVIETTNTFSIHAQVRNYRGYGGPFDGRANTTAVVIDTGPTLRTFSFTGGCVGASVSWSPVNLRNLLSRCVEVQQICNASSETMRLDDADAPGSRSVTLLAGQCTTVFNGPGTNLSAQNLSFRPTPDICGSTITTSPPPPMQINVQIACNRSLPGCTP